MTVNEEIDKVMENLILLCEVRGQLSPEDNFENEKKIASLQEDLVFLNTALDFEKNYAILNLGYDL